MMAECQEIDTLHPSVIKAILDAKFSIPFTSFLSVWLLREQINRKIRNNLYIKYQKKLVKICYEQYDYLASNIMRAFLKKERQIKLFVNGVNTVFSNDLTVDTWIQQNEIKAMLVISLEHDMRTILRLPCKYEIKAENSIQNDNLRIVHPRSLLSITYYLKPKTHSEKPLIFQ